jgi:uncharacterized membrane protein YecN with MAPEG domain
MATFVHNPVLHVALLALMCVGLIVRTLGMRRRLKIAIGDTGSSWMLGATRVHSHHSCGVRAA